MKRIEWNPSLNTGVRAIDEQHKRLVSLVNNLGSAIERGEGSEFMEVVCHELDEYARFHFRDEEKLMEAVEYPLIQNQKKAHAEFRERLSVMIQDAHGQDLITPREFFVMLGEWLVQHIVFMDKPLAEYIRERPAK